MVEFCFLFDICWVACAYIFDIFFLDDFHRFLNNIKVWILHNLFLWAPHYYTLEKLRRCEQNWPYCRKIEEILIFFLHTSQYRHTCDVLFKSLQERQHLEDVSLVTTSNVHRTCDGEDIRLSPPNSHPLFEKVNIDLVNSHQNCDVLSIALAMVWKLSPPPSPKVNIDLVNCRRNYNVIKYINMLHFMDVATSFL